jgi:hypothetical protein
MHVYSNCGSFSVTYGCHTTFFPEGTVVTTGKFYAPDHSDMTVNVDPNPGFRLVQ